MFTIFLPQILSDKLILIVKVGKKVISVIG